MCDDVKIMSAKADEYLGVVEMFIKYILLVS